MDQINTYEAKKNLSALLERVEKGESFIIAKHNKPIAELKPLPQKLKKERPFGLCKGKIEISDDFNDPLPEDIQKYFEGE